MKKLFGTDGVRGVANSELGPLLAFRLGRALARMLLRGGADGDLKGSKEVLVGRDTRLSGPMLEAALAAGLASAGLGARLVGVVPTPGVAYLVRRLKAAAGVVISASHNPVEDNGVKVFGPDGYKLDDAQEEAIETMALASDADSAGPWPVGGGVGRILRDDEAWRTYAEYLVSTVPEGSLKGIRVVIDCGNGAAHRIAPWAFERLGAEVTLLHAEPNGLNINVDCGSTHPEVVQKAVAACGADMGFSHDGDADRVIAVDRHGRLVDGDRILAILGLDLLERGRLPHRAIAATVYSNLALKKRMEAAGARVVETPAGDRAVLEAMRREGLALGGEQSGHIILLDLNTTGDGVLTALQLAETVARRGQDLSELRAELTPLPQRLISVAVRSKEGWEVNERIAACIREAGRRLEARGRLFVRASGTEPLIRVMVEGPEESEVSQVAERVADVIREELG